jgi:hypothetical protein
LTLVQEWFYKIEVIDLCNKKIEKSWIVGVELKYNTLGVLTSKMSTIFEF